jgi:hypothetical protein
MPSGRRYEVVLCAVVAVSAVFWVERRGDRLVSRIVYSLPFVGRHLVP